MLGRNPWPLIRDAQRHLDGVRLNAHPDRRSRRAVLDGVVDHVGNRIPQHQTIGRHADIRVGSDLEPLLPFLREDPERCRDVAREISEVEDLARKTNRTGVSTRQAQERVDQPGQTIDLFEHAADRILVFRWRPGLAQPHFADAANDRERGPQLVRRIGGESPQLAERRVQPREGVVDHRGQPADFILLVGHRQPLVQTLGGDASRFGRKMVDRGQSPTGEHVPADTGECHDQRQTQDEHHDDFAQLLLKALFRVWLRVLASGLALEVVVQLLLELLSKLVPDGEERGGRVDNQHQRQHRCIPRSEPHANRCTRPPAAHGSPSRNTNPTPRTV